MAGFSVSVKLVQRCQSSFLVFQTQACPTRPVGHVALRVGEIVCKSTEVYRVIDVNLLMARPLSLSPRLDEKQCVSFALYFSFFFELEVYEGE